MPPKDTFIPEICNIKHENIDKVISSIKENVEEIRKEKHEQHEEIKDMITKLSTEIIKNNLNLKNKIILTSKITGDKIDDLNNFDKTLRGNGDPGIWESIRNIKRNIKIILATIFLITLLVLGGNYRGVSIRSFQEMFGFGSKQAEPTPKIKPAPKIEPAPKPTPKK